MKLSRAFWQTYKETPADAEIPSHQLMMRAGLIQKTGSGLYNFMPFGLKVIRKIEKIIREELDQLGCHEISMSVVTPGELWQESGRWDTMTSEMLKFKDKGGRDLCMSPTNEEVVTDIFRKTVKSYKQLPITLYQINTKFRDEIRPRFGIMRAREFTMKDAYSFHLDKKSLDNVYEDLKQAYSKIFKRIGFEFSIVEADAGSMGGVGAKTHEFQVIAGTGEDEIVYCQKTGFAANIEKAQTLRSSTDYLFSEDALEEIATPNAKSIDEVANFLKIPAAQTLKSLVYKSIVDNSEKYFLLLLIGDDELNELKAKNSLGGEHVMPASEDELKSLGLLKGFIGPLKNDKSVLNNLEIIMDKAIDIGAAYVIGASKLDFHFKNFVPQRDLADCMQIDLRLAKKEDLTLDGGHAIDIKRGIEVAHIFQLGDKYTKALNVSVLDPNGKTVHPLMGCYGIGVTRIVAAAIEQNYDEAGIIWPQAIAPFQVYFAVIGKSEAILKVADEIYAELLAVGIEVLLDDRKAGAGFKFKDADLLGLPFRLVLGERDFKTSNNLEIISRISGEKKTVARDEVIKTLKDLISG